MPVGCGTFPNLTAGRTLILFIVVGKDILKHLDLCMLNLFIYFHYSLQELLDISEKRRKALISISQTFLLKFGNRSCQNKYKNLFLLKHNIQIQNMDTCIVKYILL